MTFFAEMNRTYGFLDPGIVNQLGADLSEKYNAATPFPNIVIEDFLPAELLEHVLEDFPDHRSDEDRQFGRDQERNKSQFSPENLSDRLRTLFYAFNSRPFIKVLENITGIKGLIPDPFFLGGGLHETTQGGHLSIHADFNHHKPMNLERRINVLIYLNKDWDETCGGCLELWDEAMTTKVKSVVPIFNRCVIFNTTSESYHGNPEPVAHPRGLPRRSIALYYYTSTWSAAKRDHTTQFKTRAKSEDKVDWSVKLRELAVDLTPPALYRGVKGMKKTLKG